jgi:predicted aspartyl protease
MGLTYVTVSLKPPGSTNGRYEAVFLVDTGASDTMAPASELARVGIEPRAS